MENFTFPRYNEIFFEHDNNKELLPGKTIDGAARLSKNLMSKVRAVVMEATKLLGTRFSNLTQLTKHHSRAYASSPLT